MSAFVESTRHAHSTTSILVDADKVLWTVPIFDTRAYSIPTIVIRGAGTTFWTVTVIRTGQLAARQYALRRTHTVQVQAFRPARARGIAFRNNTCSHIALVSRRAGAAIHTTYRIQSALEAGTIHIRTTEVLTASSLATVDISCTHGGFRNTPTQFAFETRLTYSAIQAADLVGAAFQSATVHVRADSIMAALDIVAIAIVGTILFA